ncbi:hypothetical protein [Kitasatospora paranensis]|uniref:Uncharacterized protein n=1 Tax=Kitasatospora paranensis TaxID=258053 RepID=A0ABW2FUA6_9ACTN
MASRRSGTLPHETSGRRLTGITGGRPADRSAAGAVRELRPQADGDGGADDQARLWHVVLSVAGRETPLAELRAGLEQLALDHSFFLTARYAADHAEIRYWEQARDLHDAAAIALRLWGEHKASANLPPWEIVGLEVVDRVTYQQRVAEGFHGPPPRPGGVHPY